MRRNARDARVKRMSAAYNRLREVIPTLTGKGGAPEAVGPDLEMLRKYVESRQWMEDFEADERGELGRGVDRSVLSEDGLYDLMNELDELMRTV